MGVGCRVIYVWFIFGFCNEYLAQSERLMNPYVGDRQLEPDEDYEPDFEGDQCKKCYGYKEIHCGQGYEKCPDCMPDLSDPGEPNDYPDDQL